MTQVELAQELGTTQPSVARLERAGSNPTWNTVVLALRATGHEVELVAGPPVRLDVGQLRERLALTPADRLRAFERSRRNLLRMQAAAKQTSR